VGDYSLGDRVRVTHCGDEHFNELGTVVGTSDGGSTVQLDSDVIFRMNDELEAIGGHSDRSLLLALATAVRWMPGFGADERVSELTYEALEHVGAKEDGRG
jgi:hypothetical protein